MILKNLLIVISVLIAFSACKKTDETDKNNLVGPAGAAVKKEQKPFWDGSLIIDLDSIARSSYSDLEKWGNEYKSLTHTDDEFGLKWELPDGSLLGVSNDTECRGDDTEGDRVVLYFSKWYYASNAEALAACGYTSDKWMIMEVKPPTAELTHTKETWISSEYRVSRENLRYIVQVDKVPEGYIVSACIKCKY